MIHNHALWGGGSPSSLWFKFQGNLGTILATLECHLVDFGCLGDNFWRHFRGGVLQLRAQLGGKTPLAKLAQVCCAFVRDNLPGFLHAPCVCIGDSQKVLRVLGGMSTPL